MNDKNIAVFGIYSHMQDVESALEQMREAGFRHEDVSVLFPDNPGSKDLATLKSSKAPEGAVAGAGTGAIVGGALGWLAAVGALAIPGVGPFLAAGPIMAALAGAGAGGIAGGFSGALIGLGMPEFEAKRFEGRIRKGGILVSVHCDNSEWVKRAKHILEHSGAVDIASGKEAAADYAKSDRPRSVSSLSDDSGIIDTRERQAEGAARPTPSDTSTDSSKYACSRCDRSFASENDLLAHEAVSHRDAPISDRPVEDASSSVTTHDSTPVSSKIDTEDKVA
jgi:Protein of unknown function (DUF3341)